MTLSWLFPRIPARQLGWMGAFAAVGALVSGLYGIAHDWVTYSVSPEYFTKLIHNGTYLGALVGLLGALARVKRSTRTPLPRQVD
jgi:hypothetical protein